MTGGRPFLARRLPLVTTGGIFLALFAAAAARYEGFGSARVLVSLLADNAFLGIAAVGLTLVIFSGGIDLSVGAVIGFTSILTATLLARTPWAPGVVWTLALGAGTALGAGMGALIHFSGCRPFSLRWPGCSSRAARRSGSTRSRSPSRIRGMRGWRPLS